MERTINTFLELFSTIANIQEVCFQFIFGIISVGLFLIMANQPDEADMKQSRGKGRAID